MIAPVVSPIARSKFLGVPSLVGCVDPHRERRGGGEVVQDRQRPVGRAVVAHHELVRQARLGGEAVELLAQIERAIVGAQGHR